EAPEQIPVKEPVNEKVTVVADREQTIRDTSRQAESDATGTQLNSWDMARQLQHEIPNGSSLVIDADEVFLAWRGARFAIQKPEDLQAFKAIQEAYMGEVAELWQGSSRNPASAKRTAARSGPSGFSGAPGSGPGKPTVRSPAMPRTPW